MLAQSLGAYGLLSGASDSVARVGIWAGAWIDNWGSLLVAAGGVFLGGWVLLRLLGRH